MSMVRVQIWRAALAMLVLVIGASRGHAQTDVDLKLVLAVDISMSMDPDEQKLQRDGYVEAFRDLNVVNAIRAGRAGRIAVTYFEWAGPQNQTVLMPWQVIDGPASANAFAERLAGRPFSRHMRTSISSALMFAQNLLAEAEFRSNRNVIDVSGDGVNNSGPLMATTRKLLLDAGIVINGLPILVRPTREWTFWDAPDLDLYYGKCVVGGPGSFMLPITKPEEFATATRQKLLLEIAAAPTHGIIRVQQQSRPDVEGYDCGMVERQIERRQWDR